MEHETTMVEVPNTLRAALRREMLLADGRLNAFQFAWEQQMNFEAIIAEIREVEHRHDHPSEAMKGPMTSGATPRVYQEGYLSGLRDALSIIKQAHNNVAP